MKVLIAEDSSVYRRLLEAHLTRWGYEVVTTSNGAEAWSILQEPDAPRLAVLDWIMPDLDGIEVCRRVRESAAEPYIYIILLTGKDSKEDVIRGLATGADDYVIKPFDAQELEVRVRAGQRIIDLQGELIAAREQLRVEASTDTLTGLLNRRGMMKILLRDLARAQREGTSMAVLMVDVDYFKKVNDTYGHPAGDAVLREVAERLRGVLRPYDALARFGGEEFLLVLPACDPVGANEVAERLRLSVAGDPIVSGEHALHVTCSVGYAILARGNSAGAEELLQKADDALYHAKQTGRNRVSGPS